MAGIIGAALPARGSRVGPDPGVLMQVTVFTNVQIIGRILGSELPLSQQPVLLHLQHHTAEYYHQTPGYADPQGWSLLTVMPLPDRGFMAQDIDYDPRFTHRTAECFSPAVSIETVTMMVWLTSGSLPGRFPSIPVCHRLVSSQKSSALSGRILFSLRSLSGQQSHFPGHRRLPGSVSGLLRLCHLTGAFWRRRPRRQVVRYAAGGFSFCRDRRFRMRCFSRTACYLFSLCLR